jgi:hypothetical protein
MSTSTRRFGATRAGRLRQVGVAGALLACFSLSACTGPETTLPPAPTTAAETVRPLPEDGDLDAGTYRVTSFTVPFEVTVPDGWLTIGGWSLIRETAEGYSVFVYFVTPTHVPSDACAWRRTMEEVDPSPDAFVAAMAAQASTETTPPVEVTMGDYSGLQFDYSVETGVDITDCDEQHICLWSEERGCTRWYASVRERETDHVIDLNGELVVIGLGEFKPSDAALTEEARAVFDSITFAPGG